MKLITPKQMEALDYSAIHDYHIPSLLLMEHAAYSVFKHIQATCIRQHIVIVCGPGNNGGDGFALARQVKFWSKNSVIILMLADPKKLSKDGKIYYNLCEQAEIEIIQVVTSNKERAYQALEKADTIVDAIFGTGLLRRVEGIYADIIYQINKSSAYTISIDIPSGLDGETGKILGACVKADKTITFVLSKLGLYLYPAIDNIGELEVADIGIPQHITDQMKTHFYSLEKEEMKQLLPLRVTRSNKATYGKVLVIGGQTGMSGAVVLTCKAALHVGAGIVRAAVPKAIHDIMEQKLTEVMTVPLLDEDGHISKGAITQIQALIAKHDVIVIGPGIGRTQAIQAILLAVLSSDKPCVIDADALYFLREMLEVLRDRKAPVIITPHPGEMSQLTGLTIDQILDNPLNVASQFAQENHVTAVLKIERTVVADPDGNIYINRYGNSGMAKGGSGDLLTGIIAGLLAQNKQPGEVARLGVYLHARAADIMKDLKTEYTFLPSDLYAGLDQAFKEIIES